MAYKSKGGCTPITAKIQKTTKGGIVQPLLNMGAPVKMKASSPAKNKYPINPEKIVGIGTDITPNKTGMAGQTPYSVENGKGKIYGPKVSYDMAYKNRDMKTYGGMSKADYIKEAKRQTKSFTSTGSWDASKPRKKQKVASTISSKPVKTVSIETKKPTASTDVSALKPKASKITNERAAKRSARKTAKAQKVRQKGIEALESGNLTKARRLKRREERIKKRAAKQADKAIEPKKTRKTRPAKGSLAATTRKSPAKQTAKQQQQKEKREKDTARANFIKKELKSGKLKDGKKNPPKVKRVYK
jgi:hypothetical protein